MNNQQRFQPTKIDLLSDPREQRDLLVSFLNNLLTKDHILMREVLKYYRDLLLKGRNLRDQHFEHLIPYLMKYSTLTVDDCWDFHRSITGQSVPSTNEQPTNDLTQFFT